MFMLEIMRLQVVSAPHLPEITGRFFSFFPVSKFDPCRRVRVSVAAPDPQTLLPFRPMI